MLGSVLPADSLPPCLPTRLALCSQRNTQASAEPEPPPMNQANSWWGRKNRAYISQASTKFTVNDVSWIRSGAGAG